MADEFDLTRSFALRADTAAELAACNELTSRYGLTLSGEQIRELSEARVLALRNTGRVEFGGGILKKLICAFCDSPYLFQETYEETLLELQDIFYEYKNESMDRISDDDLIRFMRKSFDGDCQGSLDYLRETTLEALARGLRSGFREGLTDERF